MLPANKFSACEADIQALADSTTLPGNSYQMCDFCGKLVAPVDATAILEKLSGPASFFCDFCLRHRHNTRGGRNILILSFRGLVAYLYYEIYLANHMSFSEIDDAVLGHASEGLKNPVFSYDPDTMLWYVDFNRVGNTKKKLPVEIVKDTVIAIMKKLRLPNFGQSVQWSKLETKYVEAVDGFYQKRSRPQNRRLLIPTLKGCGSVEPKGQNWDKHKDFTKHNMLVRTC